MPILKPLDGDTKDVLQSLVLGAYLDGACYEMACALSRGLRWDLVGLIQEMNGETVVRHAAVRHPEGGFWDARGRLTEAEFLAPFGPGEIIDFPLETGLRHRTRPIMEHHITMAGKLAMSLWPDLPWVNHTYVKSILAFVSELEAVCEKHGFWLYGLPNPSTWPQIATGEGDEAGYEVVATGNGAYAINRSIRNSLAVSSGSNEPEADHFLPQTEP